MMNIKTMLSIITRASNTPMECEFEAEMAIRAVDLDI